MRRRGSAVEMAGRWKRWKTKRRFPTFPTSLGNRQRRDSHIATAPAAAVRLFGIAKEPARPSGAGRPKTERKELSTQPRSTLLQAHAALEWKSAFRLTSHWNQNSISGSFLDWKMLFHGHFHPMFECARNDTILVRSYACSPAGYRAPRVRAARRLRARFEPPFLPVGA